MIVEVLALGKGIREILLMYNHSARDDGTEYSSESPLNSKAFYNLKTKTTKKNQIWLGFASICISDLFLLSYYLDIFYCFHKNEENMHCFSHLSNTWFISQILEKYMCICN